LAKEAELKIGPKGGILVDKQFHCFGNDLPESSIYSISQFFSHPQGILLMLTLVLAIALK
jgi:hypothetical protein